MKSNLLRASVIAVTAAAAVCAQGFDYLKANVPFNFAVHGKTIQAGEITVKQVSPSAAALSIRNANETTIVLAKGTESPRGPIQPRLVFRCQGGACVLAEVWGTDGYGRKVPQTARERELSAKGPVSTKTIALSLR
jgi:hypothetical protein